MAVELDFDLARARGEVAGCAAGEGLREIARGAGGAEAWGCGWGGMRPLFGGFESRWRVG